MGIALLKIFGGKRKDEAALEQQASVNMNMRMQRLLALHTQADVTPQPLPKAEKAA